MNSSLVFLILAAALVAYLFIKSWKTKKIIAEYLKDGARVIDVRSKQEFDQAHFTTAVNIPIDQFEAKIKEIGADKRKPVIVYCHAGSRAAVAETILRSNGFSKVVNARGYEALKKYER
jgi:phage shock protein E